MSPKHLFVYGTLQPGEVRWQHLARFVAGEGVAAQAPGEAWAYQCGDDALLVRRLEHGDWLRRD